MGLLNGVCVPSGLELPRLDSIATPGAIGHECVCTMHDNQATDCAAQVSRRLNGAAPQGCCLSLKQEIIKPPCASVGGNYSGPSLKKFVQNRVHSPAADSWLH